jgi:hypothetical protein
MSGLVGLGEMRRDRVVGLVGFLDEKALGRMDGGVQMFPLFRFTQVVCLLEQRDVNPGLSGPLYPRTRNLNDHPPNLV